MIRQLNQISDVHDQMKKAFSENTTQFDPGRVFFAIDQFLYRKKQHSKQKVGFECMINTFEQSGQNLMEDMIALLSI